MKKHIDDHIVEPYLLTEGPLPKSIYTNQLEIIAKKLLLGKDFEFTQENSENFITIDDAKYNWTDIIKYANLDHIELNKNDFELYNYHIKSVSDADALELDPDKEDSYRRELYYEYYNKNQDLPEPVISFQEMQAINIYTGGFYKQMNALLRGEFNFNIESKLTAKDAIIQSVMCASGLRKIPQTTITDSYRGGKMPSVKEHKERIKAASEHGVIELAGFVSSSVEKEASSHKKPVHFHFTNLKGVYVAPISQYIGEKEFLIPPTQVQLSSYKREKGKHCFEGRIVSDLASVKACSLDMLVGGERHFKNYKKITQDLRNIENIIPSNTSEKLMK